MTEVTLMIVDDSNTDRYILRRLLARTGANVDVIEYSDARTALDWLRSSAPGNDKRLRILLDLNMPVLDGFGFLDALSELREQRTDLEHVDVTVLSSSNHPEDLQRSMSFPAVVSHLVKMPSAEQLDELIRDSGATAAEPVAQVTDYPRPCPD